MKFRAALRCRYALSRSARVSVPGACSPALPWVAWEHPEYVIPRSYLALCWGRVPVVSRSDRVCPRPQRPCCDRSSGLGLPLPPGACPAPLLPPRCGGPLAACGPLVVLGWCGLLVRMVRFHGGMGLYVRCLVRSERHWGKDWSSPSIYAGLSSPRCHHSQTHMH